jgi:hypothetical protein
MTMDTIAWLKEDNQRLFAEKKPDAPATSWWASAPKDQFTALCEREALRMRGSKGERMVDAKWISMAGESMPRRTVSRES